MTSLRFINFFSIRSRGIVFTKPYYLSGLGSLNNDNLEIFIY